MSGQWQEKTGLLLLTGFLFSLSIAGVDVASRYMPPITLTTFRLGLAALVFVGILVVARPPFRWQPRPVFDVVVLGTLNVALPFLALAVAVHFISIGLAATIFNLSPAFVVLLAHFLLPDEKLTPAKALGTGAAVAGATLLISSNASGLQEGNNLGWVGQLLMVLNALAAALGVIYVRLRLRDMNSLALSAGQIFAGLAVLLPLALIVEGWPTLATYPWQAWVSVAVASVTTPVIGFWLLLHIVQKFSASLGGMTSVITPIFTAAIGILFLGDILTVPLVVGVVLILTGIGVLNRY
jgi:drug/metabolite transporter (DMT)-like permease